MSARRPSRVVLRAPVVGDAPEFVAAMLASRALHRPWASPPSSAAAFAQLLERAAGAAFAARLVCRREDGAIAGYFNVSQIVRGPFKSAYLGYAAVAAHAGHGYMTEGLELLLGEAFTGLGLHRLEANIQPGNVASLALVARAGFVREGYSERYLKIAGRWRDHERWAIRAEQWRARRR